MQSKLHSLLESITNILIGYVVAIISQVVIFPIYEINVSLETNVYIGLWFTLISLIRSYLVRRYFNLRSKL